MAFMALGLVDPILPAIAKGLNATPTQVTLLFTSCNAVTAVAMLITGAISSRIGIKWTLLLGVVVIAVFSALGGLSNIHRHGLCRAAHLDTQPTAIDRRRRETENLVG